MGSEDVESRGRRGAYFLRVIRFRCSRTLSQAPISRFRPPARQTGRAVFPHPGFG